MPERPRFGIAKMRSGGRGALGAAGWLSLAAAPTFALMALLTLLLEDGRMAALCTHAGLPSPIAGMAPMYLLMTLFHLPSWLRLLSRPAGMRRSAPSAPISWSD